MKVPNQDSKKSSSKKHPDYVGVFIRESRIRTGEIVYEARHQINQGSSTSRATFTEAREAAKQVDMWRLRNGKEPVNVLTRKETH